MTTTDHGQPTKLDLEKKEGRPFDAASFSNGGYD